MNEPLSQGQMLSLAILAKVKLSYPPRYSDSLLNVRDSFAVPQGGTLGGEDFSVLLQPYSKPFGISLTQSLIIGWPQSVMNLLQMGPIGLSDKLNLL